MFSDRITPEKFKNVTITGPILDLCLRKPRSGKSQDYRNVILFEKLSFQNVLLPHKNARPAQSAFFENLTFCVELVWTVGVTVEIKLPFRFLRRSVDGA